MKVALLPSTIINLLSNLSLSKANYTKAIAIIEFFIQRLIRNNAISEYHQIPKELFRKLFGSHYLIPLKALKTSKIILCNESYCNGNYGTISYAKGYKINPELLHTDIDFIKYNYKYNDNNILTQTQRTELLQDLYKVSINYSNAIRETDNYITELNIITGDQITADKFELTIGERKIYTTLKLAKIIAEERGQELIQYKGRYFIDNAKTFLNNKKKLIKFCYYRAISNIQYKQYYAKRNDTNYRIDTNLTSLPNMLIQHLTVDGEKLCSIDCRNSQLVLFASILKNPGKFKDETAKFFDQEPLSASTTEFIKLCEVGEIYSLLGEKLNLERSEAKIKMFEIIFSAHQCSTEAKRTLKAMYPQVIELMDGYKKAYTDNQFAILLQRIEAEIFIDGIYARLKEKGLVVYTKHDSVLYKASDEKTVTKIVNEIMGKYSINATLTIEK